MPQQPASSSVDLGARDALEQRDRRRGARQRLLVAVAVEEDRAAGDVGVGAQRQRAVVDRLDQQLLHEPRRAGHRLARARRRAAGRGAPRAASAGTTARSRRSARRARRRARAARPSRSAIAARLVEQALGDARAPAAAGALQPHAPARALEQLDRGAADGGLGEGRERVGEEDDVAARAARAPRAPRSQRSSVSRVKRGSGRAAVDAGRALEQRRAAAGRLRQRRGRRAEPVERAGSPRTAASAAACRAAPGSGRGTRPSSSPCRRSAGTRSCTPCTRGRGRGSRAAARRPARRAGRARDSALTSALARPRVACSSSRVAM